MIISVANPVESTILFSLILVCGILFFLRKKNEASLLPLSTTQELKGLAILLIVFSHIGYFLVDDHRFLFPLSIAAGVGVNLFLFLSAFGLTVSQIKKQLSPKEFYTRRLLKLFPAFWIVLGLLLVFDRFLLGIHYPMGDIVRAIVGIFPRADIYTSINSPFWYLTWLLLFYLLFPLLYLRRAPWLSALLLYFLARLFVLHFPALFEPVVRFYEVHTVAFPLGVFFGWIIAHEKWRGAGLSIFQLQWLRDRWVFQTGLRWVIMLSLLFLVAYTARHSGVGTTPEREQLLSLVTMLGIVFFYVLKRYESRLCILFGLYSYEIYLFHWPLLYRYDLFYFWLPPAIATVAWLFVLVYLGYGLQRLTQKIAPQK